MSSPPVLSIGMPVFNGAKWLDDAVTSVLTQSYTDFELIIVDNASTDDTAAIALAAASRDPRVRYYRNPQNVGAHANYDRVFELATGRYFKWASCSDICLDGFFDKCVAVLDARSDVVLAYPRAIMLHTPDNAEPYATEYDDNLHLDQERPSIRFREYLGRERINNVMNGVIRADALRRTALNRPLPGSDISMIAELALLGKFIEIPDRLFIRRLGRETMGIMMDPVTSALPSIGYPGRPTNLQRLRLHSYRFVTAFRAPIPLPEKLRVWAYLARRVVALRGQVARKVMSTVLPRRAA
jgi:glycosyltransferase involved in cell wall biosynthesis